LLQLHLAGAGRSPGGDEGDNGDEDEKDLFHV
jgi:hypothetical protein